MVTINLSSNTTKATYLMYKELVCYHWPMLKAAFMGPFQEAKTQTINLELSYKSQTFGIVQNWMYTQTIEGPPGHILDMSLISSAWVLADRLMMPMLHNALMKVLITTKPDVVTTSSAESIYETTSSDSKLRSLLIDKYAFDFEDAKLFKMFGNGTLYKEFFVDIAKAWKKETTRTSSSPSRTFIYDDYKTFEPKL